METFEVDFSSQIQLLRKILEMNQTEFAEFLEIPQPTLSAYETGRNTPNMDAP